MMNENERLGGLPESADNPAFPDITSDFDSGYSSDPLGSSGSSFPDIGSGFDSGFSSDPLGSSGLDDFPEISTDDFASIHVDETVSVDDLPPTPEPQTPASAFPDVTKPAHDNGIPDPVPPPPVTVPDPVMPSAPAEMPSISLQKPAKAQAEENVEEDFAGDHYVWNGREYVETDTPSGSYSPAGTKLTPPPEVPQYSGNTPKTGGAASYNQSPPPPPTIHANAAKSVRNFGIFSLVSGIISCFSCSPISVILAIIALIKSSALKKHGNELNVQEEGFVKTGVVTAIIALVINIPAALLEMIGFLIAIFMPE